MPLPDRPFALRLSLAMAGFTVGCGGAPAGKPSCLSEPVSTDCMPQYDPTFANVFKYTLSSACSQPGCHEGPEPKGGLGLESMDEAYANLLDGNAGRVEAGNTACGEVIVRLESKGEPWSMPRGGNQLSTEERCSVRQWIANGAHP